VDQNYRDPELGLELSLATQLAASDPRQALEIGEEALSRGEFSSWLVNLLAQLQAKDKDAAARLAAEMLKRLRTENLIANQEAKNVALNLLSMGPRPSETGDPSGVAISGRWGRAGQVLDESAFRELLELVIASALNSSKGPLEQREYDSARNLLVGLQSLLPQIDRYLPARAPAVRRKLAEMEKTMDAQARAWNSYNNLVQQGSVDAILDAAPKAPADVRSNLYWQAAQKALSEGNAARARQIANEQFDPAQRVAFLQDLDRQLMWRQMSEGKIEEARQLVARLRSVEERVQALVQLSATASQKELKKLALQLLDEARSLVSRRAENYAQLEAQLQVARAYSALEPARSFELLEPVIEQINAFIPAAALLNGFETHYFKEGELPLQGGSMLGSMIQRLAQELAALARVDFERTQALAERFERPEPRIAARLAIAQGVLAKSSVASGAVVGVGFGVSYGRGSWRQ
jgi:hypothetical protein